MRRLKDLEVFELYKVMNSLEALSFEYADKIKDLCNEHDLNFLEVMLEVTEVNYESAKDTYKQLKEAKKNAHSRRNNQQTD